MRLRFFVHVFVKNVFLLPMYIATVVVSCLWKIKKKWKNRSLKH